MIRSFFNSTISNIIPLSRNVMRQCDRFVYGIRQAHFKIKATAILVINISAYHVT